MKIQIQIPTQLDEALKDYKRSEIVEHALFLYFQDPDFQPPKKYDKKIPVNLYLTDTIIGKVKELTHPFTNKNIPASKTIIRAIERYLETTPNP